MSGQEAGQARAQAQAWKRMVVHADAKAVQYEEATVTVEEVTAFAGTPFERYSHQEMLAMVESADPHAVATVAHKLKSAADTIEGIGQDLKAHMDGLPWYSPAGNAFRDWGGKVATATLQLSDLSATAGSWMEHAGQTLHEVKGDMPAYPTAAARTVAAYEAQHPDGSFTPAAPGPPPGGALTPASTRPAPALPSGPTYGDYATAKTQLADAHGNAVRHMRKLGTSYSASDNVMARTAVPKFPALPTDVMPPPPKSYEQISQDFPAWGGGGTTSGAEPLGAASSGPAFATRQKHESGGLARATTAPGPSFVRTRIDGTTSNPVLPSRHGEQPRATSTVNDSPTIVRPVAEMPSLLPGGYRPPNRAVEGLPHTGGIPEAGSNGVTRPASPRTPSSDGIIGGQPGKSARGVVGSEERIPHGAVIGAEPAGESPTGARSPSGLGSGLGTAAGSSGAGTSGQTPRGRRLASEPGGAVGAPQRGSAAKEEAFTPGGTGLASRDPGTNNDTLGSMATSSSHVQRRGHRRPDYLVEDEETWVKPKHRSNPLVIE